MPNVSATLLCFKGLRFSNLSVLLPLGGGRNEELTEVRGVDNPFDLF